MIDLVKEEKERAVVVGLVAGKVRKQQAEEYLDELSLLADTAGATVVHRILQDRDRIDSTYYVGKGKVEQLAEMAENEALTLFIFDDDLSPAQVKNLEDVIKRKIVDRSGLILDIFASRARTNESRTQVELAQLQYLLPRLTRQWTHLSKQYGGIGTKGPGETQIETDRRIIRQRISVLKEKLEKISQRREIQRKGRKEFPTAALVGYTNAGKSTLMNALSDARVFTENRLFATLDTTTRIVALTPSTALMLSDTVGFIRKLPHHLIASFKSTLEEVVEADVLVHVVDICHPQFREQIAVVDTTLDELGATDKPTILVFNKIDALTDRSMVHELQEEFRAGVFISAERGINLLGLRDELRRLVERSLESVTIAMPQQEYRIISALHEIAEVTEKTYEEGVVIIKARVSQRNQARLRKLLEEAGAVILNAQKPVA